MAAVVMVAVVFKEKPVEERMAGEPLSENEAAFDGSALKALWQRPVLIAFSMINALLAWVYAQSSYALPLHMIDIFADAGAKLYGFIGSINGFEVILLTPIVLMITKKIKPTMNLVVVSFLYMVGFGLYGVTQNIWVFYLATAIWTLGEIIGAVNIGVYIANHTPVTHRGRFQSLFDIIYGAGRTAGPLLAGMILITHSLNQLWFITAAVSLLSALLLYALYRYEIAANKKKKRTIES